MENSISFSIESIIARKDPAPRFRVRDSSEQLSFNCERHVSVLKATGLINHSKTNCVTELMPGLTEHRIENHKTQENARERIFSLLDKSPDSNRENSFVQHVTG